MVKVKTTRSADSLEVMLNEIGMGNVLKIMNNGYFFTVIYETDEDWKEDRFLCGATNLVCTKCQPGPCGSRHKWK